MDIKNLIKLADKLDRIGLKAEANLIDQVIKEAGDIPNKMVVPEEDDLSLPDDLVEPDEREMLERVFRALGDSLGISRE